MNGSDCPESEIPGEGARDFGARLRRRASASSSQFPVLSSQKNRTLFRWLKFNLVGGIGIGVQLAALAFFCSVLHLDYLLATALAVETAVIHNFLWHERVTWRDRPALNFTHSLARVVKFNLSNGLISIVGNLLVMRLLAGALRMNEYAANAIAIAACSLVNFLLGDRLVFRAPASA